MFLRLIRSFVNFVCVISEGNFKLDYDYVRLGMLFSRIWRANCWCLKVFECRVKYRNNVFKVTLLLHRTKHAGIHKHLKLWLYCCVLITLCAHEHLHLAECSFFLFAFCMSNIWGMMTWLALSQLKHSGKWIWCTGILPRWHWAWFIRAVNDTISLSH